MARQPQYFPEFELASQVYEYQSFLHMYVSFLLVVYQSKLTWWQEHDEKSSEHSFALKRDSSLAEPVHTELPSFTLFAELGAEIRVKIWQQALPTSIRLVETRRFYPNLHFPDLKIRTALLHVSKKLERLR